MASEMIKEKGHTKKVDVYSFGVVLWELLTGLIPFNGLTPEQAAFAVAQKNARPTMPSSSPMAISHLISQCWATNPEKRPNFDEIVVILESHKKSLRFFLSYKPIVQEKAMNRCFPRFVVPFNKA